MASQATSRQPAEPRHGQGDSAGYRPMLVTEIELASPLPDLRRDGYRQAWILARLMSEPLGACVLPIPPGGLSATRLGELLWARFREPVLARLEAAGRPAMRVLTAAGLPVFPAGWPHLMERAQLFASAPLISVVVCTRNRPDRLESCLDYLEAQRYPWFEVVITDNAPTTDQVPKLIMSRTGTTSYSYIREPKPGLAIARNTGLAAAEGDIVAFVDDDEAPDRYWLASLAAGFAKSPDIGCVTGPVLPARLDTPAQQLFERLGGQIRGRAFAPDVFARDGAQSPAFPLPPFGAGGNMAFRREALADIGGFDEALGPGTPAMSAEDTLAFTLVLLAGYRIAYQPSAFVWHDHHRDLADLRDQLHGRNVGLTAYYAALLRHKPYLLPKLLGLAPAATVSYLRGTRQGKRELPADAAAAQISDRPFRELMTGPAAYLRGRSRQATL
jgi:O-antigen biosynthesis protein